MGLVRQTGIKGKKRPWRGKKGEMHAKMMGGGVTDTDSANDRARLAALDSAQRVKIVPTCMLVNS
jgi:hypothetical protein